MNRGGRQSGFSLMEVMFAVLVLTMGMVFVACQFPVGMMNSRKIAETTLSGIDAHNSQTMVRLQLEGITNNTGGYSTPGYPSYAMEHRDSNVHLLVKPNVPANCGPGNWQLVLDDLESYPYALPPYPSYGSYVMDTVNGLGQLEPRWLFWSQRDNPATPLPVNEYSSITTYFIGDIGSMMCPPVDISDRWVQKYLQRFAHPGPAELNAAIFDTAMKRNYSWSALYRCMDWNVDYTKPRRYCFYIFTLRTENKSLRYAVQSPVNVANGLAVAASAADDRVFPVPWRIDLNNGSSMAAIFQRYYIRPANGGTKNNPILPAPRIFELNPAHAKLLQAGSIIVDADMENPATPWVDNGYVYEVEEVTQTDDGRCLLKLRKELEDDLRYIWVFPPAFDRNTGTFVGPQPVVNVEQMVVTF